MFAALVSFALAAAPFPLPAVDGKPLAVTPGQKSFRLPMRFDKVRAFYEEQFKDATGVTLRLSGSLGSRFLTLSSKRTGDGWTSAVVKEGELETVVDLKPVLQMGAETMEGKGPPVQFIFTRSPEVKNSLETIDPTRLAH